MSDSEDIAYDALMDMQIEAFLKQTGYEMIYSYFYQHAKENIEKINRLIINGKAIYNIEIFDMALVSILCGIELLIRYFYVKPLLGGMLLNEDWFYLIDDNKIISDRSSEEHEFLKKILAEYKIDILNVNISNDKKLWNEIKRLREIRNKIIHHGQTCRSEEVLSALSVHSCLIGLLKDLYKNILNNYGKDEVKKITEGWVV